MAVIASACSAKYGRKRWNDKLADLLAAAGFNWFEIGLQSTNPRPSMLMKRPTQLKRFVAGPAIEVPRDQRRAIDLIIGLPGDDLQGFMRSVDFVADHGLQDDIQIFPLSILPGTDFRRRSRELGLRFENHPPYTVTASRGFSPEDFLLAYDYAETRLDTVFFPLPDLDVSGAWACRAASVRPSTYWCDLETPPMSPS